MIALLLGALTARRAQAVTLVLLSLFATAAAVAGPVYLRGVDQAIVANELATARSTEQTVSMGTTLDRFARGSNASGQFEDLAPAALDLTGFALVYASEYPVLGIETGETPTRLAFRDLACQHLRVVAGRCLMAAGEIVIVERTAQRAELAVGDVLAVPAGSFNAATQRWEPVGRPAPLTVVGVVRPVDPGELFWGTHAYFTARYEPLLGDVAFTTRQTLDELEHEEETVTLDAYALPGTITADSVGDVRADVTDAIQYFATLEDAGSAAPTTDIPALLDRITANRALAGQLVPLAALPVVLLCWLVIFTAVAYGTQANSAEVGLLALRGLRTPTRWWLAAGEIVVAVLVGAPLGYLAGHALVRLVAADRLAVPDVGALDSRALPYAAIAVAGALLAGLAALRAQLAAPVVELLRRTAARGWQRRVVVEVAVVVLAVAAAVQLRLGGGRLVGFALVVPALVVLAFALLAGRVVKPVAGRLGSAALGGGRVGLALAAWLVSRRPGAQRLAVLLVMAVGVLSFAVASADVASAARVARAEVETGAATVLSVQATTRTDLLRAVRTADPEGGWAMAVARLPEGAPGESPRIAVDSTRLAAVALWRSGYGGPPVTELAARLRPPAGEPYRVRGTVLSLDATVDTAAAGELRLAANLAPENGGIRMRVAFDRPLTASEGIYTANVPFCSAGCRLVSLELGGAGARAGTRVRLTDLRQPDLSSTIPPAGFGEGGRWVSQAGVQLTAGADGLAVEPTGVQQGIFHIAPADGPHPLPVASTAPLPEGVLSGLDRQLVPAVRVAELSVVPGLGRDGILVDLEYADRAAVDAGAVVDGQVWLTAGAPADAAGRLTAAGLVVLGQRSPDEVAGRLAVQSPAHALWFATLAAGLAVLLGVGGVVLVAAVDRRASGADLRALRAQGLRHRPARRATRWSYLLIVLVAAVVGPLAAAVAWLVVGSDIPVFVDGDGPVPPPAWPDPVAIAQPWLAAVLVLTLAALVATWRRAGSERRLR